jgi:hypothetical protein
MAERSKQEIAGRTAADIAVVAYQTSPPKPSGLCRWLLAAAVLAEAIWIVLISIMAASR